MTALSFVKASLERAIKTFAQVLGALLVAGGTDLLNTDWAEKLSVAGMATLLSILSSLASAPFGGTGPSLSNEVISPPAVDPTDPDPMYGDGGYTVLQLLAIIALVLAILALGIYLFDVDLRG